MEIFLKHYKQLNIYDVSYDISALWIHNFVVHLVIWHSKQKKNMLAHVNLYHKLNKKKYCTEEKENGSMNRYRNGYL